jgi:hypothetical protein
MIVKHTKPFVTYVGEHFFYPGNNEFNEEISAKLQEMPDFRNRVESGMLQIIGASAVPTDVPARSGAVKIAAARISVSNLAIASATKVIQGTYNKAELLRVQAIDQRKGIQDAITAQLAVVDGMAGKSETGEE